MRLRGFSKGALAGAALAAALLAGYAGASLAAPAGAVPQLAGPMDETTPEPTTPTPDPAPPAPTPKPAPKPVSKPSPAPVRSTPTYRPPLQSTPTPSYSPPAPKRVAPSVHKKKVAKRRPKPVQRSTTVAPKRTVGEKPAPPVYVQIGTPTAAVRSDDDAIRRVLIITGLAVSIVLFLLAAAVPATAARFTPPGRVVMDHQVDLVLSGLATLLLTVMLSLVTGG